MSKSIIKRSLSELDPVSGTVADTWNVQDKTTNAPSERIVEEALNLKADKNKYRSNDDFVVITGKVTLSANDTEDDYKQTVWDINYPTGLNKNNCVIIAFNGRNTNDDNKGFSQGDVSIANKSVSMLMGGYPRCCTLLADRISGMAYNPASSSREFIYQLVLMKLPELTEGVDYKLGDVDGDGEITQADADLVLSYYVGTTSFTEKQFKAADYNRDGKITPADATLIQQHIGE